MQFAKDSFYVALRDRLAVLNPSRTVRIGDGQRPALIVVENELPHGVQWQANAFYLEWGPTKAVEDVPGNVPILSFECTLTYRTGGAVASGVDRGRVLGELDAELLSICRPCHTEKRDFSQVPSVDLGTGVFWTLPQFEPPKPSADKNVSYPPLLERQAHITVFFFPEGAAE